MVQVGSPVGAFQDAEGQTRVIIQNVQRYGYLAHRDVSRAAGGFAGIDMTDGRDPWAKDCRDRKRWSALYEVTTASQRLDQGFAK